MFCFFDKTTYICQNFNTPVLSLLLSLFLMRKYISILLLLIFLYNFGGYYLWFRVLQYNIQEENKQETTKGLKEKDLSLIIVPLNDQSNICWTEKNEEFIYKGEMYDIVKTKTDSQHKYFYCINDTNEKLLIANFNKSHNSKKDTDKIIKSTLDFKYLTQKISISDNTFHSDFIFPTIDLIYKSNIVEISSPPPNIV